MLEEIIRERTDLIQGDDIVDVFLEVGEVFSIFEIIIKVVVFFFKFVFGFEFVKSIFSSEKLKLFVFGNSLVIGFLFGFSFNVFLKNNNSEINLVVQSGFERKVEFDSYEELKNFDIE